MRWVAASLALWCSTFATATHAGPQRQGVRAELGFRSGYSIPFGKGGADATADLNESVTGVVPLWFDVGLRVTPNVTVGVFLLHGFGILGDTLEQTCNANSVACSVSQLRIGGQVHYHFMPYGAYDPWLGVGSGYESLSFDLESFGQSASMSFDGFQFVNFQAGVDFETSPTSMFTLGLFADFALAQYSDVSCAGVLACSGNIDETIHQWLTFGLRGAVVP